MPTENSSISLGLRSVFCACECSKVLGEDKLSKRFVKKDF